MLFHSCFVVSSPDERFRILPVATWSVLYNAHPHHYFNSANSINCVDGAAAHLASDLSD